MHSTAKERRITIFNKLYELFDKKLPKAQAELLKQFVPPFYSNAPIDDLENHDIVDLYGATLSQWNLSYQRARGETKIHIFNPQFEGEGWQSTHTIIQIAHDDMPFLVDSLRMEINRLNFDIHVAVSVGGMQVKRDSKNQIIEILPHTAAVQEGFIKEAPIYFEVDKQTDPALLEQLKKNLGNVLFDVSIAVADWQAMRAKLLEGLEMVENTKLNNLDPVEVTESIAFLRWLMDNHFTLLGVRDYDLSKENNDYVLRRTPHSGLGVLRDTSGERSISRTFATLPVSARKLALSQNILIISKTNTRSTVHRNAYTDYIGIKRYNEKGEIIGERRLIGLFTSTAYHSNPRYIPFLRHKVEMVTQYLGYAQNSHAGKDLLNILETLPRDDLFQTDVAELSEICEGILQLQERKVIRLFAREDAYGRFISCLVYVPREIFNTRLRMEFEKVLMEAFQGTESTFSTYFSESVLARIHFLIRINPQQRVEFDAKEIEKRLIALGVTWQDQLTTSLVEYYGEEKGLAFARHYVESFPVSYQQDFDPRTAVFDIGHIEDLKKQTDQPLAMSLYRPAADNSKQLFFKIFYPSETVPLSDIVPMLEHMGLRIIGERPYELTFKDGSRIWINDFSMVSSHGFAIDVEAVKGIFHQTFAHVWLEEAEDDGFNELVLGAQLNWREITILRAYAKYFRQIGFTFSQQYIEETCAAYPEIAKLLVVLFEHRFDPTLATLHTETMVGIEKQIEVALENVSNLDQDRILRRYLQLMKATIRTNYYQVTETGLHKNYLSFKFNPLLIEDLPLPLPLFEIFVYSPRVEGVHLRGAKVARGGLRWSDRREDFRTEVLGLMKAQQVKNAVIVPLGAKGGFVPKLLPQTDDREVVMTEVKNCYKTFIRGLLDLTDNLVNKEIVAPANTVRYDEDDIYLVVAADKGTATFSDLANSVSAEYNFWLADAFASGGSSGYDHKKMGITAKGAWESVKRHFHNLGINTQTTDFTAVGIGDMSGDVFGNGMLLSEHIQLVAAFDHRHIFLDPTPISAISFKERLRLFNLPRSSWADYNPELISQGGGVYPRSLKSIPLSAQMKQVLLTDKEHMTPNDLIRTILKAPVELLWNGGIGTYVKASTETHSDVGDRSNDGIRVNGNELRCRVVGEGGNLGFTQLGRVEYALAGGLNFTDFIDNSGGVNCSDIEVNIKILLNAVMTSGDMTEKQRNVLLEEMTPEVAELVLRNNYTQPHAINLAAATALENTELYSRYILELEHQGKLNRELEFLPSDEVLHERKARGQGLTQPELAILLAYTKITIKGELLESNVPEDRFLRRVLKSAFPKVLNDRYAVQMHEHSLRREIIATQVSNIIVNEMGITFVHRLLYETGAPVADIVRAYAITRAIYQLPQIFEEINAIDNKVPADLQQKMVFEMISLMRRATRWFLRYHRADLDITSQIDRYSAGLQELAGCLPGALLGENREYVEKIIAQYIEAGVPQGLARRIGSIKALYPSLDIIEGALQQGYAVKDFAATYYAVGEYLHLGWLRQKIGNHPVENHWDALARSSLRDDIDIQQVGITLGILKKMGATLTVQEAIQCWAQAIPQLVQRWQFMLADLRAASATSFIMFAVVVRECLDLAHASQKIASV